MITENKSVKQVAVAFFECADCPYHVNLNDYMYALLCLCTHHKYSGRQIRNKNTEDSNFPEWCPLEWMTSDQEFKEQ